MNKPSMLGVLTTCRRCNGSRRQRDHTGMLRPATQQHAEYKYRIRHLTITELTMWPGVAVWQPTPKTADVTVTKIAGYVRVRILMNRRFFRIFGIHSFYATATLLNMSLSPAMNMWLTDAAEARFILLTPSVSD